MLLNKNNKISLLPIVILFCLFYFSGAYASTIRLTPKQSSINLHEFAERLEDETARLDLDAVMQDEYATAFTSTDMGNISFGFTTSAYWFRFQLQNPTKQPLQKLLVLRTAWLDSIQLYMPTITGQYQQKSFGDTLLFTAREYEHPQFLIELTIPPGTHTYYLRLATSEAFMAPIELWEPDAFHNNERKWAAYFGMFYGVLLVMLFYNGFIYFSTRDKNYLYYCIYLFVFLVMNFSYNGFSFQYLWPESPTWVNWSYSAFIALVQITGLWFAVYFLEMKQRLPRFYKFIKVYLLLMTLLWAIPMMLGYLHAYNAIAVFFVPLYACLVAIAGLLAWMSGYRAARFFVVASFSTWVGILMAGLTTIGILNYSFINFHMAELGLIIDAVLLSFALADRIKFLQQEKQQAQSFAQQQQSLAEDALRNANETLENKVAERTQALIEAKERAESLARLDALTGVSNRRFFEELAAREFSRTQRYGKAMSLIVLDVDSFKLVNDQYGHAAGDKVLTTLAEVAKECVRDVDLVARIGGEEFAILLPEVHAHQALQCAERLRERIHNTEVFFEDKKIHFTASFGVAERLDDDSGYEVMLQRADRAMYAAKYAGKDRVSSDQESDSGQENGQQEETLWT